jgi:DnaK suppressor protein
MFTARLPREPGRGTSRVPGSFGRYQISSSCSDVESRDEVDESIARERLHAERIQIEELLNHTTTDAREERSSAGEQGDMADPAEPLIAEQEEDAVAAGLRDRLEAIKRAEQRLADGTYGRSVLSGRPIPDDRLEADPAAELTVDEV